MANNQRKGDRKRAQLAAAINPPMTLKGQQVGSAVSSPQSVQSGQGTPIYNFDFSKVETVPTKYVAAPGKPSWDPTLAPTLAPTPAPTPAAAAPAPVVPEFDWNAWNAEMLARQQAVMESMDAMNSAFISQLEAARVAQPSRGGVSGSVGTQDPATVKIKKRTRKSNTSIPQMSRKPEASGLSIGKDNEAGGSSNGLGIVKQDR